MWADRVPSPTAPELQDAPHGTASAWVRRGPAARGSAGAAVQAHPPSGAADGTAERPPAAAVPAPVQVAPAGQPERWAAPRPRRPAPAAAAGSAAAARLRVPPASNRVPRGWAERAGGAREEAGGRREARRGRAGPVAVPGRGACGGKAPLPGESRAAVFVRLALSPVPPAARGMAGEPWAELLSFRAFQASCPAGYEYGYGHGGGLRGLREREFPRLRGTEDQA